MEESVNEEEYDIGATSKNVESTMKFNRVPIQRLLDCFFKNIKIRESAYMWAYEFDTPFDNIFFDTKEGCFKAILIGSTGENSHVAYTSAINFEQTGRKYDAHDFNDAGEEGTDRHLEVIIDFLAGQIITSIEDSVHVKKGQRLIRAYQEGKIPYFDFQLGDVRADWRGHDLPPKDITDISLDAVLRISKKILNYSN